MLSRKEFLLGLGGTAVALSAAAKPVRSLVATTGTKTSGTAGFATAKDYIQDGLAVLFDGKENVGWGLSDTESSFWVDLVNNVPCVFTGQLGTDYYWGSNCYCKNSESNGTIVYDISGLLLDSIRRASFSVEVVTSSPLADAGWQAQILNLCTSSQLSAYAKGVAARWRIESNGRVGALNGGIYNSGRGYTLASRAALNTDTLVFDNGYVWTYSDGIAVLPQSAVTAASDLDSIFYRLGSKSYAFRGAYHCTRLYNRPLSALEIARNVATDKTRFA